MISQPKMVVQMGQKESEPLEEDLIFLINMLDQEDREEFAEEFAEDLEVMLSKSGLWKVWLANKIREKMKVAERILAKMEAEME